LEVSSFELTFANAFAVDSACSGLRLVGVRDSVPANDELFPHWSLIIDFVPGEKKQNWRML
jgi:hypothetical protein